MTNCCLLIETFVSWTEPLFLDTHRKSERCFGFFFLTQTRFAQFAKGGLKLSEYKDLDRKKLNNTGTPCSFYRDVRCALLHNGETRNGWRIVRNGTLYDESTRSINAIRFMDMLKDVIKDFKKNLDSSDFNDGRVWITYKERLRKLIDNS